MLTLLRNARLYAPEPRGLCDLLLADRRVAAIAEAGTALASGSQVNEIDLGGRRVIPGLVDPLVHFIGGGGEGGFATRTAELTLADAVSSGVTTLIGALGTDALTRTPANLLGKARELAAAGLTTYAYTGSYQLPPATLTGTVNGDIVFIPDFIGVGEVAISDHRGSQPSWQELARLASEARTAGMLAGKSIPLGQFYPTHINRTSALFEDGLRFVREGGRIDFTTSTTPELLAGGEIPAAEAVDRARHARLDMARVSLSSDANASLPRFDAEGNFLGLEPGRLASLFEILGECINSLDMALEQALPCASRNAADALHLPRKGRLKQGSDADLLVLADDGWAVDEVWAGGQRLHRRG